MSARYNSQAHQRDRTQLFGSIPRTSPGIKPPYSTNANSIRTESPNASGSNTKPHYTEQMLSDLESQNDEHIEGLTAKVRMLKDVSYSPCFKWVMDFEILNVNFGFF